MKRFFGYLLAVVIAAGLITVMPQNTATVNAEDGTLTITYGDFSYHNGFYAALDSAIIDGYTTGRSVANDNVITCTSFEWVNGWIAVAGSTNKKIQEIGYVNTETKVYTKVADVAESASEGSVFTSAELLSQIKAIASYTESGSVHQAVRMDAAGGSPIFSLTEPGTYKIVVKRSNDNDAYCAYQFSIKIISIDSSYVKKCADGYYYSLDDVNLWGTKMTATNYQGITNNQTVCGNAFEIKNAWVSTPVSAINEVGYVNMDTGKYTSVVRKTGTGLATEIESMNVVNAKNASPWTLATVTDLVRIRFDGKSSVISITAANQGPGQYRLAAKLADGTYVAYDFLITIFYDEGAFLESVKFGDNVERKNLVNEQTVTTYNSNQSVYFLGAVKQSNASSITLSGFLPGNKTYSINQYYADEYYNGAVANQGVDPTSNSGQFLYMPEKSYSLKNTGLGFHQVVIYTCDNTIGSGSASDYVKRVFDFTYVVIPDDVSTEHAVFSGMQATVDTQINFYIGLRSFLCSNNLSCVTYSLSVDGLTFASGYTETDTSKNVTDGTFSSASTNSISVSFAAKNIVDKITVKFYYKGVLADELTTSVAEYMKAVAASSSASSDMKAFANKYLVYGACAQIYFGYKTGNLAVESPSPSTALDSAEITAVYDTNYTENTTLGTFCGASLILNDVVKIKYYYRNASNQAVSGDDYKKSLSVTQFDEALKYCKSQLTKNSGNTALCNLCRAIYDLNNAAKKVSSAST